MKANEAPKKIYLSKNLFIWSFHEPQSKSDIEYIRTDAFIEIALSWLKNHYRDYMHNPTGKRLEAFFRGDMCNDFEEYMKGE